VIPSTGRVQPWSFHPEPAEYLPKASYRVGDDVLALVTLARAGIGLIQTYDFVVAQDVARGAPGDGARAVNVNHGGCLCLENVPPPANLWVGFLS
jgi:hypothetical protein